MGKQLIVKLGFIGVVVLGMIGYRVFFVDSDEVRHFNDKLVDMVSATNGKFTAFTKYLDEYGEGNEVDVVAMTTAREQLAKSVADDEASLKAMEVPDDELCKKFHGDCLGYVSNSVAITEKYEDVIAHVSERNPGGEDDVIGMYAILDELVMKDEALFKTVAASQAAMAKKFDLELE